MGSGVFGSIRPANIIPSRDAEILYYYRPSRGETDTNFKGFKVLDASECLVQSQTNDGTSIEGMFNLRLPLDKFSKKGFYTIYIRPKEISTKIVDVSVLAAYPTVKGVVLSLLDNLEGYSEEDLVGCRIEIQREGKDEKVTRIIKSCNRCTPVVVNTGDGYPKSTRYNLIDSGDYVFCTVSPSSSPTFKVNAAPYIGSAGKDITVVNTKFSPVMYEVEMTEHDMDTLSYMLEGDQVNDRDNAIITTYNDKHEIYHQSDYYVLKDKLGQPLYNVKKKRDNIDQSQDYDNIIG